MAYRENQRLYASIARDVAARIAAGEFAIGTRLPTEKMLSDRYKVSRPTVREAIIALEVDGLVQTRMGSGVHVINDAPKGGRAAPLEMGPFELLEARRSIEGEACAIAANRITPGKLQELASLLGAMQSGDTAESEAADEQFHIEIAHSSENSGLAAAVEMLFQAKHRSPQYRLMQEKAHARGIFTRVDEHQAIYDALANHDAKAARAAMRRHLARVLENFMEATALIEAERIQEAVSRQKQRYATCD